MEWVLVFQSPPPCIKFCTWVAISVCKWKGLLYQQLKVAKRQNKFDLALYDQDCMRFYHKFWLARLQANG